MGLRLLLVGPPAAWLPPWRAGRLVVGPSPEADFRLAAAAPYAPVQIELQPGGVSVRAPGAGELRVPAGGSFHLAGHQIVVIDDAPGEPPVSAEGPACLVCRSIGEAGARTIAGVTVCAACARRLDIQPGACPGYQIVVRLGLGGFGVVYLAVQRGSDGAERLVAIKAVRATPDPEKSRSATQRLRREIEILARLDHPSIVRLLDAIATESLTFLVSEFVPGGDARARLERAGRLAPEEVVEIGVALAGALAYAHERGIVHRDVKPENVLFGDDGRPRLIDFGLAKQLSGLIGVGLTSTGSGLGTVLYAAPEQLHDARAASPAVDVWGLAATLFHLATGEPPRRGKRAGKSLDALALGEMLMSDPPRADEVCPAVPGPLARVLEACFAREPRDRPNARELGARLAALRSG